MEELVSIIIPVYNAEKNIEKCLDSVLGQSYNNIEVILVNDGSTDKSLEICNKYEKVDSRVKVIDKKNTGVSDSRNTGLKVAKGEWISFVDSDDWIDKEMIKKMHSKVVSTNFNVCICNYYNVVQEKNISNILNTDNRKSFIDEILGTSGGFLWNKLYKRDLIGKQKFDGEVCMCEDLLFNCKLAENNIVNYCIIEEPLYYYYKNENGVLRWKKDSTKLNVLRYIIEYYEKNNENKEADKYRLMYISDYLIAQKYNPNEGNEYSTYYYKCMKQIIYKNLSIKDKIKYLCIKYFKNIYLQRK